jgi:hypothetical protein
LIGAQLLMHLAHLQHGMHQLHLRQQQQQGLGTGSGHHPDQQQQGGFGSWRLRMPWQRQEGQAGGSDSGLSQGASSRSNAAWQAEEAAKQWIARGVVAERNIELREALACYTNAGGLQLDACVTGLFWSGFGGWGRRRMPCMYTCTHKLHAEGAGKKENKKENVLPFMHPSAMHTHHMVNSSVNLLDPLGVPFSHTPSPLPVPCLVHLCTLLCTNQSRLSLVTVSTCAAWPSSGVTSPMRRGPLWSRFRRSTLKPWSTLRGS